MDNGNGVAVMAYGIKEMNTGSAFTAKPFAFVDSLDDLPAFFAEKMKAFGKAHVFIDNDDDTAAILAGTSMWVAGREL